MLARLLFLFLSLSTARAEESYIVQDDILVPTPDGARIAVLVVRPRGEEKRVALLNFTIYAKDKWSLADAEKMAAHGYAGVVAYTRGKGRSPGPAVPYEHDGADAAAVIEWLAAQPWSDGRVGMFSGSYNAFTQWAAAKHHPAALKAIATNASNAPGIDTPMQGNVFQSFIYPWPLYTTDTKYLDDALYDDTARWESLKRKWFETGRPYRDLDKIDGKPNPIFGKWLDHPAYDSYWQAFTPQGKEFASIDIPVFVETGYYDGGMVGALYYFQQHYRYRPDADHRLLVGPYHHIAMQVGVLPVVEGYEIDPAARIDLQAVRLAWFDHVFHGAPLPDLLSDKVNFEVMGANEWRHVSSLDQMAEKPLRLDLTGELRVDLADRTTDHNSMEFATAPLDKPTEVAGLFKGRLSFITNKRDFDLSVEFFEQRPDGTRLSLASYLGRASYMADRSQRHLLQPGRKTELAFQSQTLTARRLTAGSRIVAVVGIPKQPGIQINYGTGKDVSAESIAEAGEPVRIAWQPGSYLELRVR